ncbi:MAG: N-acetylmuramoyl-L-alanine amidase [Firmicutes bacterium]|nr:N-acetylmuramoyl-L-alanine amidase [Bacillota bacterium]
MSSYDNKRKYDKKHGRGAAAYALIALFAVCLAAIIFFITKGSVVDNDIIQYDNDGNIIEIPEWITVDLLPINEYSRPGESTDAIVGIVVHYVGNAGTSAKANRSYFEGLARSGETYASSNFIIGLDGEIIECVPLGEIAYCSNSRNIDTVSIECCHPDETGEFTDETYESLVKLTAWLSEIYDLDPTEDIIRHYDVTGKLCPLWYVEHEDEWELFKSEIAARIGK